MAISQAVYDANSDSERVTIILRERREAARLQARKAEDEKVAALAAKTTKIAAASPASPARPSSPARSAKAAVPAPAPATESGPAPAPTVSASPAPTPVVSALPAISLPRIPPPLTDPQLSRYTSRIARLVEKLDLTPDQAAAFLTDPVRNELATISHLPILSSLPFASTLDDSCREDIPGGMASAINLLEWEPQHPSVKRLLDSIYHAEAANPSFSRANLSLNRLCRTLRIPPLDIYNELTRIALKVGSNKASIRSSTASEQITARSVAEALQPGPDGFEDRKIHLQYAGIAPVPKTAITNISGQNIGGIAVIGSQNGLPAFEKDVLDLDRQPPPKTIEGHLVGEPTFDPGTMSAEDGDEPDEEPIEEDEAGS